MRQDYTLIPQKITLLDTCNGVFKKLKPTLRERNSYICVILFLKDCLPMTKTLFKPADENKMNTDADIYIEHKLDSRNMKLNSQNIFLQYERLIKKHLKTVLQLKDELERKIIETFPNLKPKIIILPQLK